MNWETLYCPHRNCRCYGKPFQAGLLVKNGSSYGAPQARCNACGGSVALRYGTAYYGLQADRAIFDMAVRALAEGHALRATARIVQVDKDTVCAWLDRVARHCRTVIAPGTPTCRSSLQEDISERLKLSTTKLGGM